MQKINLKKTTKDKLYTMLCEFDANYQSLKDETERRVETLNDELIKANLEIAGLRRERDDALDCALRSQNIAAEYRKDSDDMHKALHNVYAHPWRHLWKCLWRTIA